MTTWVKVYNTMPQHPKVLTAGDRAAWLFVCGLCYSNEHLTDGFIPRHSLPVVAPGVRGCVQLAARLVAADLWHAVDGGWRIHEYEGTQRTSAEIREKREKDRERKRESRADSDASPRGQDADSTPDSARTRAGSGAESARIDVDVDVEGRRQKAEIERNARKRAPRKTADQSQLPDGLADPLRNIAPSVLEILLGVHRQRGGWEPTLRGVGLALNAFPDRDHVQVARDVEHWLVSGNGREAKCDDIVKRFRKFLDSSAPVSHTAGSNVVSLRERAPALRQADAYLDGYDEQGHAIPEQAG